MDLTVTSPPYDNLRTYNGNIDQWSFEKFKAIAKELYRVTADGGVVVCYNEGEQGEFTCDECGKKFRLSVEMTWEYTTETVVGEMTEEEWEIMRKEG